jgi:MFS family permease
MKKVSLLLLSFVILFVTLAPMASAQDRRRHHSRFGRKSRTAAMVGGGAVAGALIGGRKGAAIGAGGAGLYAFNRKAARRHFKGRTRTMGTVASGTAGGAGLGGAIGGKKGAVVGAIAGAGGSTIYRRRQRSIYHRRY